MNSPRLGLRVAAVVFGIVALAHLWRMLTHLQIRIGTNEIPQWPSVAAAVAFGGVAVWLWGLSTKLDRK